MKIKLLFGALLSLTLGLVGCDKSSGKTPGSGGNKWSTTIQQEMEYYLGEVIPFVKLDSATLYHEWDSSQNGYFVGDESPKNLVKNYASLLEGWEEAVDSEDETCYVKENQYGETLQLYFDWYEATSSYPQGNEIAIYVLGGGIVGNTIDFTQLDLESNTKYNDPFEAESFSVQFGTVEGKTSSTGQYVTSDNGDSIRVYPNGFMKFVSTQAMKSIEFAWIQPASKSKIPTTTTAQFNTGEYDATEMVWSGSSTEVILTCALTSNHFALAALRVNFD